MFQSPDNRAPGEPLQDIDLDFTKPEYKIKDLQEKIAAATRGIILAESINDIARADEMARKKEEFEKTLATLQDVAEPKQEFWVPLDEEDDFSRSVGNEHGGAINKMERRTGA